ncbi:hypothetical protein ACOME3_008183 [Neoechinorhynchus agilis]
MLKEQPKGLRVTRLPKAIPNKPPKRSFNRPSMRIRQGNKNAFMRLNTMCGEEFSELEEDSNPVTVVRLKEPKKVNQESTCSDKRKTRTAEDSSSRTHNLTIDYLYTYSITSPQSAYDEYEEGHRSTLDTIPSFADLKVFHTSPRNVQLKSNKPKNRSPIENQRPVDLRKPVHKYSIFENVTKGLLREDFVKWLMDLPEFPTEKIAETSEYLSDELSRNFYLIPK